MLQSSWIQLLFVNSHLVSLRPQFTDLVAYINYAYVMYVKYFFNIFHTAQQAAIIDLRQPCINEVALPFY